MTMRPVTALEAEGADFMVCLRLADAPPISTLPRPVQEHAREVRRQSLRVPCGGCGATCLRDPQQPSGPPTICTHCHKHVQDIAKRAAAGGAPS